MSAPEKPASEAPRVSNPPETEPAAESLEPRRDFLAEFAAIVIGAIVAIFPFAAGAVSFLSPVIPKSSPSGDGEEEDQFVFVTTLGNLKPPGEAGQFPIIADRKDAWNVAADQRVGSVYLIRQEEGQEAQVKAFNAICPHAGCFVNFTREKQQFFCPCHNSAFSLAGEAESGSPSPRGMDELQVEIRNDDQVFVAFENYYVGTSEKIAK